MHRAGEHEQVVRIVRYVSECDVVPITVGIGRRHAMRLLRAMADKGTNLATLDLVDAETGRFVSWVL